MRTGTPPHRMAERLGLIWLLRFPLHSWGILPIRVFFSHGPQALQPNNILNCLTSRGQHQNRPPRGLTHALGTDSSNVRFSLVSAVRCARYYGTPSPVDKAYRKKSKPVAAARIKHTLLAAALTPSIAEADLVLQACSIVCGSVD